MQRSIGVRLRAICLIFAIIIPGTAQAAPVASAAAPPLQAVLDQFVKANPGTGIIAGVIDGGTTTIRMAGVSGRQRPLDEHTLFEIGSVTKTFTGLTLASMAHDGLVGLDDPIQKYLPPSVHVPMRDGKPITLVSIATQHSGLPRMPANFNTADDQNPYVNYHAKQMYAFVSGYKLTRDPGAAFEYSNLGLGLLGVALSNRAHLPYESLVRARVWKPLGMSETAIALSPAQQQRFAQGHDVDGKLAHSWEFDALAGAGAIRSSMTDMLKYARCVMGQGPLGALCLSMQRPRATIPSGKIGLVWWIDDGTGIIEHVGDTNGYHAMVAVTPDHKRAMVVLANGGPSAAGVGYAALGVNVATPTYEDVAIDPATIDAYVGTYGKAGETDHITIARDGNRVTAQLTGQPSAAIYPLGNDHFFYKAVTASYRFFRDANGAVIGLALFQDGAATPLDKLDQSGKAVGTLPASPFPPVVPLAASDLDRFAGTYQNDAGQTFVIAHSGDGLTAKLNGQPVVPIFAMGTDRFYYKIVDAELQFTRAADGAVTAVTLHQSGYVLPTATRRE